MTTDVVVIGGGVAGLSAAYHLAEAGAATVLLERGPLGSGASRATADVLRTYFAGHPLTSTLAARSLRTYRDFAALTGTELPMKQTGYLVLLTEPEQITAFHADLPAQQAAGIHVELIDEHQARQHNPLIGDLPLLAAAWSPHAYITDTTAIVTGLATAARRAGAELRTHCPATTIDPTTGRVDTPQGPLTAHAIVCAAGAWSAPLAHTAGITLPLTGAHTQELLTTDPLPPGPDLPVTLHAATGLLIRRHHDRLLVGMGHPGPDRHAWTTRLTHHLTHTYPSLEGTRLHTAVTGIRDLSPDRTAFIGRAPQPPHTPMFLYAAGFSGHGLCIAPAAGALIRDLYLGHDPHLDTRPLAATPDRVTT
ncbi:FAD-dependent oxidoreductase [Nonomuraea longicatena]|uniref:FAD-binding oxidoreductase n=1 Tax=Nonomuraea longicatena TaxID=83682 RepID=A0ABP4AKF3_9ACTN